MFECLGLLRELEDAHTRVKFALLAYSKAVRVDPRSISTL
jgi:hypothetical protein